MSLFFFFAFLMLPAASCGGAGLLLVGSPPDYRLEAIGFSQVAAVDVTIHYDPAVVQIEGMTVGPFLQGAMAASNAAIPGKARLGAVTTATLTGSGLLATLKVKTAAATPSFNVQGSLRDLAGKPIPVETGVPAGTVAPPAPAAEEARPEGEERTSTNAGRSVRIVPRRLLAENAADTSLPQPDVEPMRPEADRSSSPAALGRAPQSTAGQLAVSTKEELAAHSPFDLFRRDFAEIHSLADLPQQCAFPQGVHQEPCPVLSDGRNRAFLRVENAAKETALGVQGGKLLDSWWNQDGTLQIELLPDPGTLDVTVIVLDEVLRPLRLVVAPAISFDAKTACPDNRIRWQDLDGDGSVTVEEAWTLAVNLLAKER